MSYLLSVDVEIVKLLTIPQILRDWLPPEPFIRLSLFANAILAQHTFCSKSCGEHCIL